MTEPAVTIKGQLLTAGEVMTLRVALNALVVDMSEPGALGDDEHGKQMAEGYKRCAHSMLLRMVN